MINGREKMKIEAEMTRHETIAVSKAKKLIQWYAVDAANQMTEKLKAWADVERLQGELEKFHECETSNGCLDENGYLHTLDNLISTEYVTNIVVVGRKVYHKEGE